MAYQNVGTPRFYIDNLSWAKSMGLSAGVGFADGNAWQLNGNGVEGTVSDFLHLNPSKINTLSHPAGGNPNLYPTTGGAVLPFNFIALLGHANISRSFYLVTAWDNFVQVTGTDITVNSNDATGNLSFIPDYNGWSLATFTKVEDDDLILYMSSGGAIPAFNLNSIVLGTYYDMPHSPDLKLTMSREMDGVKRIRTKGGADLVNHKYYKPAAWGTGDYPPGAWELYAGTPTSRQALSRSGRRLWSLSFSFLSDSSTFPEMSNLNWFEAYDNGTPYTESTASGKTLLDDDTFYNQVIHKTNGGQLPFIFQPDQNDNTNFAIAKFDMKSFKFEQVANGVYNVKLKIREVW